MIPDVEPILLGILIAMSGWTLASVVDLKVNISALKTQLRDLPCNRGRGCPSPEKEKETET